MAEDNVGRKTFISEQATYVSVGVLTLIVGIVISLVTFGVRGEATETRLSRFVEAQTKKNDIMYKIDQRLSRIEGKLGIPDSDK